MAALDWLQSLLGGGQYGDPSTPAMSTQPLPDDALTRLRDTLGRGAASSLFAGGGDVQPGLNLLGRAVVAPALAGGAALEATMTGQPVSAAEMLQAAMMGIAPTPTRLPGGVPSATPTVMERLWADEYGGIKGFHGSPKTGLKVISASPPARQFDNATSQFGAFIAPTEQGAARYAGDTGKVYAVEAPIENPYDMSWKEFNYFQSPNKTGTLDAVAPEQWASRAAELKQEAKQFRDVLAEAGYDGVVVRHPRTGAPVETASFGDISISEILRKYGILPPLAAGGGLLATGSEPPT